jgi:predicted lipid-binding transport protein (Tim44 family)
MQSLLKRRVIGLLWALCMVVWVWDAHAGRLGGGRSMGRQSTHVAQRQAAPQPQPVHQPGVVRPVQPTPPMATPAKKPWGGMLGGLAGGLAAGLGLSWLMHSMGMGGGGFGFGSLVMLLGLVALGVFLIKNMGRRSARSDADTPASVWASQSEPALATAGAYGGGGRMGEGTLNTSSVNKSFDYRPEQVGNDASARPWERPAYGAGAAIPGASALSGSQTWGIPADFDVSGFLTSCKANYLALQKAWDTGKADTLRTFMDDSMWQETQAQLAQRGAGQAGAQLQPTEVLSLDAHLLGIEELTDTPSYMASVEFSGTIKEDGGVPASFREVWNLTKAKSGHTGWLLAGIQVSQSQ